MGLFDKFKKKRTAVEEESAVDSRGAMGPDSVDAVPGENTVCAPVTGTVIAMSEVPDPVFSTELLGAGCAVWPEEDCVYAPVSGSVTVKMDHAVGIRAASGIEVLVHCGIDTVSLDGKGFVGFVEQGDEVEAGQPILKMDRACIAAAGCKDCVVVAVSNTAEFARVDLAVEAGSHVRAGASAIEVTRA